VNLLVEANRFCRRLYRDESGVVLALTVIISLTLWMLICGVYVVGETIRQRMEIQNAADAAAYSAALVQADGISRVAAINRAMSWTYAQSVKRNMDYIVDKWLERVLNRYYWRRNMLATLAITCSSMGSPCWYTLPNVIRLNERTNVSPAQISMARAAAMAAGSRYTQLRPLIQRDQQTIEAMNRAEAQIIANLGQHCIRTARLTLQANLREDTEISRQLQGNPEFMYAIIHDGGGFWRLENPDGAYDGDGEFLKYADLATGEFTPLTIFGPGTETPDGWFMFVPEAFGIQRKYYQKTDRLKATWNWSFPECNECPTLMGTDTVLGRDAMDVANDPFFQTAVCQANKHSDGIFMRPGSTVIGVARRLRNPLQFVMGGDPNLPPAPSFHSVFTIWPRRFMWAVAAARPGYRDAARPGVAAYNSTRDAEVITMQNNVAMAAELRQKWRDLGWVWESVDEANLENSDWDAILMPVSRIWSDRKSAWQFRWGLVNPGMEDGGWVPGYWTDHSGGTVLTALWAQVSWESVSGPPPAGHLSDLSADEAPPGMSGGELQTIQMGGLLRH